MMKKGKNRHNQRGVALITVLLIISILVAVSIELNRSSRADIYDAANLSDGIKLTYIAKSGFYGGAALLLNQASNYDTLNDDWSKAEMLSSQSVNLFPDGSFIVRIEDETGKIPLNKLVIGKEYNPDVRDVLLRLLSQPEFQLDERKAAQIVDAIKDWIDEDDEITGSGAESSYYASAGPPYGAKNAPLDCIEELLMIRGVNKEIFAGTKNTPALADYVTVYSDGLININTAPKLVLRSLAPDISEQAADKMDEYRRDKGNDLSSPLWYQKVFGMAGIAIKPSLIANGSNYFKITSVGKNKTMEQKVSGVIKRSKEQKTVRTISWRQE